MDINNLPKYLTEQIAKGNVILFLGSGASYGALHPQGHKAPIGQALADLIAKKFLDPSFVGKPLMHVAQIAISEANIFEVQKFVSDIFTAFKPAEFHKLLPTFKWKSVYTTNYDFIIEDAYDAVKDRLQILSRVIRNTKDNQIFIDDNSLPYYKLHGCLSVINDESLPLILTPDQYISHQKNRDRLFGKFYAEAWNHIVLFAGFSFGDIDILTILNKLENEIQGRSRFYFVGPSITDSETRFWESKSISGIKSTFEDFIKHLDKTIPVFQRKLSSFRVDFERPIFNHFIVDVKSINFGENFLNFLDKDIEFVHIAMNAEVRSPKEFYKGYFENWDPIIRNLDANRDIKDSILSEVVLQDYYSSDRDGQFLFLIKGHAGSGKSVLLKRIAWDAAVDFNKFCIVYSRFGQIRYENIAELYNYVKQRIFVFVDNGVSNEGELITLLDKCKKDKLPITIFTAERANVWNSEHNHLKYFLTSEFALEYLSAKEINELLNLLERHNSLGFLETKSKQERVNALKYRPGFELLVTLYEATHGKPLKEIIADEYNSITNDEAKSLYLTVSLLHRLNSFARAGLIGRVHGISLDRFRSELHEPLDYIVFDRMDYRIQDYVYHTRHPYIAELVVENVLVDQQKRFEEYRRILAYLDVDFESDRKAFNSFTNAKKLLNDFSNYKLIDEIYENALKKNKNNSGLYQQMSIYEAEKGNLGEAEKYIKIADQIAEGKDPVIQHTFSELEFKKAEATKYGIEKKKYLDKAIQLADKLTKGKNQTAHAFHTVLKAILGKLDLAIEEQDENSIQALIKDFERKLSLTKQTYPYQEFILEIEARFNEFMNNKPLASELLEKAHKLNPANPFITARLVSVLEADNNYQKIGEILDKTLKELPGDKEINFLYAQFLIKRNPKDYTQVNHYLGKSYTEGDNRHFVQFLHAKNLYLAGEVGRAKEKFALLSLLNIDPEIKNRIVDPITENNRLLEFKGIIKNSEYNYGFITREQYGDDIYFYRSHHSNEGFSFRDRVRFNVAFNYRGLIAINLHKI